MTEAADLHEKLRLWAGYKPRADMGALEGFIHDTIEGLTNYYSEQYEFEEAREAIMAAIRERYGEIK